MKVLLVQPPLLGETNRLHLTPPLGLLSIGAVLREESVDVEVLDLNLKAFQDPALVEPATFYEDATALMAARAPDVVDFTSMALESHVGLELARRLKLLDPQVVSLFGGPHFSSIATEAMTLYPWMDYVVTGAAEHALVALTQHLRGQVGCEGLINVAHRTSAGVVLERQPAVRRPLDDLPHPAHDLVAVSEYFEINRRRMLCIEHARGCQLRCSFCYSEAHWGHGENAKSIERTIEELTALADLGAAHAFFVADNFVTSRKRTERLCAAIAEANLGLTFHCYATLAQLDEPTVKALANAGCNGVFVGVDAVSPTNKRAFRKTYFKGWEPLRERLETCLAHGVRPTCSFMLSCDDELDGVEQTLQTAILTRNLGAELCLNALAIYNQTDLEGSSAPDDLRYSEAKPELLYSTHAINCMNEYARRCPRYFPMHQTTAREELSSVGIFEFCRVARDLMAFAPRATVRYVFDRGKALSVLIYTVAVKLHSVASRIRGDEVRRICLTLNELASLVDGDSRLAETFHEEILIGPSREETRERLMHDIDSGRVYRCRLKAYCVVSLSSQTDATDAFGAGPASRDDWACAHLVTSSRGKLVATPVSPRIIEIIGTWSDDARLTVESETLTQLKQVGLIEVATHSESQPG